MIRHAAVCIVLPVPGTDDVIFWESTRDGDKGDGEAKDAGWRVKGGRYKCRVS